MISLDFNGGSQSPADYTPDFEVPSGFQAGENTGVGTFIGDGESINSGWIATTISGVNNYAEATWSSSGNSSHSRGPIFVNSAGDGYLLLVRSSDFRFFRIQGGSLTQVGSGISQSTVAGDLARLSYLGSGQFQFSHNGTQVGSATDTTITTGLAPGFVCRDVGAHIDAFEAGALAGSVTLESAPGTAFPGQSRTLTVTGAEATQGTGGVTIGGVAQTVTAWSDTSITFTTVLGSNSYGAGNTLQITTGTGEVVTGEIELLADDTSGFGYVTMNGPDTTDTSSVAYNTTPIVVTGDQFEWEDFNNLGNLEINAQGFVSNVDSEGTFRGRFWDATDSTWGATETFTASTSGGGDVTGPTIGSVNVPAAGSYGIGDPFNFTVNWDEAVTVTGTPRLPVNLTTGTVYADYASGDGTTALVFTATVQEGDNDADGITLGAIELNGGTIRDASANNATLTLAGVENTTGILVDGVRPVITVTGENPYTITVGDTYTDPGATASDNQDGSLGSVTGTGSVDEQTEGQYTITYPGAGVVDSAGNAAVDATRTVNVNAAPGPDDWPFSKGIRYAAAKNWKWGKRHPKTGMRVRIYDE